MPRKRPERDESEMESFIEEGSSTPGEGDDADDEIKTFSTRFPKKLVDQIDEAIDEQMVSESRNRWLMKAAVEKLERQQS